MESKVKQSVINKIKNENVTPESKVKIVVVEAFKGFLVGAMCVISLIGLYLTILYLRRIGIYGILDIFVHIEVLLILLVWIGFVLANVYLAFKVFIHTEDGYRYSFRNIFIVLILIIVVISSSLIYLEKKGYLDALSYSNNIVERAIDPRVTVWNNPQRGRISGVVNSIENRRMILTDINGDIWNVDINNISRPVYDSLRVNTPVRIVGKALSNTLFVADRIINW